MSFTLENSGHVALCALAGIERPYSEDHEPRTAIGGCSAMHTVPGISAARSISRRHHRSR
jgi:hypothetical protein